MASRKKSPVFGIVLIVIVAVALFVAWHYFGNSSPTAPQTQTPAAATATLPTTPMETGTVPSDSDTAVAPDTGTSPAPGVKEFTINAANFSFSPSAITVKKGDHVKITVTNSDGVHDFKIDEFNVATPRIQSGQTAVVEFDATKTGSFQYYCSVGSHRAMGMWGTLSVTE